VSGGAVVAQQRIDDSLDPAVADRRHGDHRVCGEEKAHGQTAEAWTRTRLGDTDHGL
jgi:hypothetical protein